MRPHTNLNIVAVWFVLMATSAAVFVQAAPVSESDSTQSLENNAESQSDNFLKAIIDSRMLNECDINQDKKDLCERCIRFVKNPNQVYLGCCTNYDGYDRFCTDFVNFEYKESKASKSGRMSKKYRQLK